MYARYVPSAGGQTAAASSGEYTARHVPEQPNAPVAERLEDDSKSRKSKRKRAGADATSESTDRKSKKSRTADRESDEETAPAKMKKDKKDKKKKKKRRTDDDEEQERQLSETVDDDGDVGIAGMETATSTEKKKAKREKKKRAEEPPAEEDDDDQNGRHKSVLEQMAKSLKMSSEAAANQTAEEAEEEVEQYGLEPLPQPEQPEEEDAKPTYDTLPSWLSAPIRVSQSTRTSFTDAGIPAKTAEMLQNKGYAEAFAVQTVAIPLLLPNNKDLPGDLLISAATGSGKTLAYALPIVNDISQGVVTRLRALVVLPTRELVRQAQEVFELCSRAYEGSDRKRVRIGVSVGSQQLKVEQETLIERGSRYDPETYKTILQQNLNAKGLLESADLDIDDEDRDPRLGPWDGEVTEFSSTVDVLICTPGRLVEHIEQTPGFDLDYVRWLVVDEADKLLAQSFQGWLETVMAKFQVSRYGARDFPDMPYSGVRKVILSATLTRDLSLLNQLALRRPRLIVLDADDAAAAQVSEHTLPELLREYATRVHDVNLKPLYLLELLRGGIMAAEEPEKAPVANADVEPQAVASDSSSDTSSSDSDSSSDSSSDSDSDSDSDSSSDSGSDTSSDSDSDSDLDTSAPPTPKKATKLPMALIFTKSNESALRLSRLLALLDPSLTSHTSTLTSTTATSQRRKTLRAFTDPSSPIRLIVASDLVARGIDIPNLAHVVNYDLPPSLASYVHRVGRTARAGRAGRAWTLVADGESGWFWGKIAKGSGIRRAHRVERARIEEMPEERVREYETALEKLGQEAHERRRR
ncbi:DEAD-like helicase [Akanthomyces lecanii RCEF 1005]|uniref:ATP-dependent RNA helicase n=1 Tax=Akanthomyces lecanii RCEF 1005 TaxID=1081108 RepID=A0A168ICR5_CORDF|nr:DEAD-like helicase [Akanthomyces lecanii RCEF 1005]